MTELTEVEILDTIRGDEQRYVVEDAFRNSLLYLESLEMLGICVTEGKFSRIQGEVVIREHLSRLEQVKNDLERKLEVLKEAL